MPKFRFETTDGKTTIFEEELASADLPAREQSKSPRAAIVDPPIGADQSGSTIRVYDEAGYLVSIVNFSDVMRDSSELQRPSGDPPAEEPGVMRSG